MGSELRGLHQRLRLRGLDGFVQGDDCLTITPSSETVGISGSLVLGLIVPMRDAHNFFVFFVFRNVMLLGLEFVASFGLAVSSGGFHG